MIGFVIYGFRAQRNYSLKIVQCLLMFYQKKARTGFAISYLLFIVLSKRTGLSYAVRFILFY